jgi:hypothetical protein
MVRERLKAKWHVSAAMRTGVQKKEKDIEHPEKDRK